MKRIVLTLVSIILLTGTVFAQAPKGFNYQAVVRNSAGQLMANRMVSVRISIMQGSANGTTVYQQTESVNKNGNGLFTLVVGENSNDFANINWGRGPYYILSEIDPNGGSNYTLSTSQKILAVPYAHYATVADRISENFTYDERDPLFRNWGYLYDSLRNAPTRLSDFINDLNFLTADDLQLTLHGDTLFINNNSYVILPNNGGTIDWDSITNRPTSLSQFFNDLNLYSQLRVSGDTLFLNDSTYVILNNNATTIQWDSIINRPTSLSQFINDFNFRISGDTLFLNDNVYVILPELPHC